MKTLVFTQELVITLFTFERFIVDPLGHSSYLIGIMLVVWSF